MFKENDIVKLRFHDVLTEIHLVGPKLKVIKKSNDVSPYWIVVELDGIQYSVRGSDCILVRKG